MERRFHINQDVVAGLMFIFIGTFFLYFGRNYPVGSTLRMGPGYLPNVLGWLLVGIGVLIGGKGVLIRGDELEGWALRPLILVAGAFLVFSQLIERLGLIGAAIAAMLCASAGSQEFRLKEQIIVAVSSACFAAWLFIHMLELPMRYWPPALDFLVYGS